jgi:RNA polymerase sigma-70 factor (TIGR02960 family)
MSTIALDESAFAARAEPHRRELHVHCYRMLGNFDAAEDTVQETLLRAWRHRDTFKGEQFRAWLYRIATNVCLDELRRTKRRVPAEHSFRDVPWLQPYPDRLLDEIAPREEEPEAVVVTRETIELAYIALIQALPPRQRAVVVLRDVLDWSAKDTAEALGTSVAAANSALQRARATMSAHRPVDRLEHASPDLTDDEKTLLQRFIETHQSGDRESVAAMIADDIRVTMPPMPMLYEGRDQIMALFERAATDPRFNDWLLVPTRANRMPTAASYCRQTGDTVYRAFKFDVLRIENGVIAEITTFGASMFEAFGLPPTWDPDQPGGGAQAAV